MAAAILTVLVFAMNMGDRLSRQYAPSLSAAESIKYHAAVGHLWFEEILSGDRNQSVDVVWQHLDQAARSARLLRDGGEDEHGVVRALEDKGLRREVSELLTELAQFRAIAEQRYALSSASAPGTAIDQEFDAVFVEFLRHAEFISETLYTSSVDDLQRLRRVQWSMIALVVMGGALVGFLLTRADRRRRAAALELAASRNLFRAVVVNADPLVFATDEQGLVTVWEGGGLKHAGRMPGEAVGRPVTELFADQPGVLTGIVEVLAGRTHRTEIVMGDFVADTMLSPIMDAEGRVGGAVGMAVDVTAQRRAQAEVVRLGEAMRQTGDAVFITDPDGTIVDLNAAFERCSGYGRQELIGRRPNLLKSGEHDDAFYEGMWGTITAGRIWRGRIINRRRDGALVTENLTISPMVDGDERITHFVAVSQDITRQLDMEAKLQQAQKLEAVGLLAGGIAHDFNNILQAILGHAELAAANPSDTESLAEDLEQIRQAAERASGLTRQLLAYSRRQILEPADIDLNRKVTDILNMLRRVMGADIDLEFTPGNRLGTIHADPGQMDQVVLNLCVNARDAMPDGGHLSIETENVLIDADYVRVNRWATEGRYVLLSVGDTGVGMSPEDQARVFEPFFTTKDDDGGTGLGLATVYGVVKQHGGMINLYSEPGRGTLVKVYLPSVERAAVEVGKEIQGPVIGGTEVILVAEDDPDLGLLIPRILTKAGYTVVSAENGQEAIERYRDNAERIDCAILDVVMPGMGGRAARDEILRDSPGLPVLFISGYNVNAIHTNFVLEEGLDLLRKPFGHDELLRRVRGLLDRF